MSRGKKSVLRVISIQGGAKAEIVEEEPVLCEKCKSSNLTVTLETHRFTFDNFQHTQEKVLCFTCRDCGEEMVEDESAETLRREITLRYLYYRRARKRGTGDLARGL